MDNEKTLQDYMNEGEDMISIKMGYHAMIELLRTYYEKSGSIDLTDILSAGNPVFDGYPLDKAFWYYWVDAIEKLKKDPQFK